ncbi:hypothetical protein [Pseudomethylobacillus aquaticus]|uniref:hypothetical protein n=1 Tax=Pseudomethylobacillus aquaticus TaxID=2676064 RepID=UPI0011CDFE17|nr:hypothetical protein [Pseudomethylobacillus aquaticus]
MFQGAEEERRVAWLEKMVKFLLSKRTNGGRLCEILCNVPDGAGGISHAVREFDSNKIVRAFSLARSSEILESEDLSIYKQPFMSVSEVENRTASFSGPGSADFVLSSTFGHPNIIFPRQIAVVHQVSGIIFISEPTNPSSRQFVNFDLISEVNSPGNASGLTFNIEYEDGVVYEIACNYSSIVFNSSVGNYPTGDLLLDSFVEWISIIKSGSGSELLNAFCRSMRYFPINQGGQPWITGQTIYSGPVFIKLLTCPYLI